MAKYNIDDILSELGVNDTKGRKHQIDKEQQGYSPIPSVPSNQRAFGDATAAPAKEQTDITKPDQGVHVGPAMADLYRPQEDEGKAKELGAILLSRGVLTEDRLNIAQNVVAQSPGKRLVDALLEQGVDEANVLAAVAEINGVPFERIDLGRGLEGGFDGKLLQRLTPEFCKKNGVVPLRTEGQRIVIATTQPDNITLMDEVRDRLGASTKIVLTTAFDVRGAMELIGEKSEPAADVSEILADVDDGDVQVQENKDKDDASAEKDAKESPVIRYVNHIIQLALQQGASDIHVEPSEKKLKVRFRIDGELYEALNPPASMGAAITSRLKIMANLAIDQRRLPQDGRIRATVSGKKIDLRVSTLPCVGGEKTVMRILNEKSISVDLDQLGFDDDTLTIWKKAIDAPHGVVLVTGPTGSGKTTTLYASLRTLDKNAMNISTVEDPVEYTLEGVTQSQMHEKIGMTFGAALRALLRQDPDVILLGEIRDHETAHIAVQAALTGHLVLSTLHTNDAPSSVTRLVNIGLEPFLVGAAVNAVLAQRLIRRLCKECKEQEKPLDEMAEFLAMQGMPNDMVWASRGCDKCRKTGFSGRVGIYELLSVDDQLRDIIARNPNVAEFRRMCVERGMVSLRNDGLRKVSKGLTTVQEVLRVTEASH